MPLQPTSRRAAAPFATQAQFYGLLTDLIGTWAGHGFNLISRPAFDIHASFVLQVNPTKEVLTFSPIGGVIPDRGSVEPDLDLFALAYTQLVSDENTSALLHIEDGMWMNQSVGAAPPQTITRLASIPHGTSVLAQGTAFTIDGAPTIASVSPVPTLVDGGAVGEGYFPPEPPVAPQVDPAPIDPAFNIANPNTALTDVIKDQTITNTTVLKVSTVAKPEGPLGGGILNIPFVTRNANAIFMEATFWIETVTPASGPPFLQLQYTQNVTLQFPDTHGRLINWPHISLSTLVKN